MTIIFFAIVAVSAIIQQIPIWKLSPLAWLKGWGYASSNAEPLSDPTINDMERQSKGIIVVRSNGPNQQIHLVDFGEPKGVNLKEANIGESEDSEFRGIQFQTLRWVRMRLVHLNSQITGSLQRSESILA